MPAIIPSFLIELAEPLCKTEKFLWKELPGDMFQEFGKSLDMKARIHETAPKRFELELVSREGRTSTFGPFRNPAQARLRAEAEYSAWIRKNAIIEDKASAN